MGRLKGWTEVAQGLAHGFADYVSYVFIARDCVWNGCLYDILELAKKKLTALTKNYQDIFVALMLLKVHFVKH